MKGKIENGNELKECFEKAGAKYGFVNVNAEFKPYSSFTVKWKRGTDWIDFTVSDYLIGTPVKAIRELADDIYAKIEGGKGKEKKTLTDYVLSERFRDRNVNIYLERNGIAKPVKSGKLYESCRKYSDIAPEDLIVTWAPKQDRYIRNVADGSVLMRVVRVSPKLRTAPEFVLDYVVYSKLCEFHVPFSDGPARESVEELRNRFEMHEVAEEWLRKHALYV